MTDEEVLKEVLRRLEEHHIEYMITGSHASNLYSVGRSTADADIIIRSFEVPMRNFITSLQGQFYADINSAIDALRTEFMFNIIHLESGYKIDIIVLKKTSFDEEAFRRRAKGQFLGKDRWFLTAEDSILSKLAWQKAGGSERQAEDAIAVAKAQFDRLDFHYLRTWAKHLDVSEKLEEIIRLIKEQL